METKIFTMSLRGPKGAVAISLFLICLGLAGCDKGGAPSTLEEMPADNAAAITEPETPTAMKMVVIPYESLGVTKENIECTPEDKKCILKVPAEFLEKVETEKVEIKDQ
ncbi:MAG: hypothetical protein Q7T03_00380 [Deltaproteobacteria bacterium]|nr:hypothetical protein [Deltaproteobacteria bacterium]